MKNYQLQKLIYKSTISLFVIYLFLFNPKNLFAENNIKPNNFFF
jgi:hypothetical protein